MMDTAPAPLADDRLLIPGPEARHKLGDIGWTKFCELMNAGELERVNIGRRSFVTAASLHAYVERLRANAECKRTSESSANNAKTGLFHGGR